MWKPVKYIHDVNVFTAGLRQTEKALAVCSSHLVKCCDSLHRAALSHSGSPGVVPEENGTLLGDAHNVSEWQEVITGEEVPFEFETRGKLRHR